MKKKVDVILIKDDLKQGKKGVLVHVTRGYAFNYLIPSKIAEIATPKKIKQIQMFENIKIQQIEANQIETQLLQNNIEKINKISIYKKRGENNLIFGSVTEKEIIKWIKQYTNLSINKIKIQTVDTKSIGIKDIKININTKIQINIPIYIIPTNI
uniref:Large ribosomal subunit protein bL9c n=1 Tax=Symphyocladiella dendroidea TaxID=2506487 RepID=A0A1Z1M7V0_9FLOR|nr:ribosomal protein L9 [Symphyocladiella dendroidea]ARW61963.1 ribosomal protein L9 [Symphyocladiella dendroidea]